MVAMADIEKLSDEIRRIAEHHGARHVRVFGSVARRATTQSSDLDLLVRMDPDRSLLDRIALKQELEDLLGVEVDVVNENALRPAVREQVLQDMVEL